MTATRPSTTEPGVWKRQIPGAFRLVPVRLAPSAGGSSGPERPAGAGSYRTPSRQSRRQLRPQLLRQRHADGSSSPSHQRPCRSLVNCGQCGCLFAVPAALAGGELHCPHGHAFTPAPWDELEACGKIVKLQTALADVRVRLEAAKARIEALTPLAEPTAGELRRRSRLLAEHAEDAGRGCALCPYCGASKGRGRLPEHIRRRPSATADRR